MPSTMIVWRYVVLASGASMWLSAGGASMLPVAAPLLHAAASNAMHASATARMGATARMCATARMAGATARLMTES